MATKGMGLIPTGYYLKTISPGKGIFVEDDDVLMEAEINRTWQCSRCNGRHSLNYDNTCPYDSD